jgi:alpha-D-ribose 1-methylphosphonate 5-triphosphate synthase subunit PhnI
VQHLKLPHYVDFQAELELVRKLRASHAESASTTTTALAPASPLPTHSERNAA